jgi:hypothetical protein
MDIYIRVFLTSALVKDECLASRPGRFTSQKRAPGIHWTEGWVGSGASLNDAERRKTLPLLGFEL